MFIFPLFHKVLGWKEDSFIKNRVRRIQINTYSIFVYLNYFFCVFCFKVRSICTFNSQWKRGGSQKDTTLIKYVYDIHHSYDFFFNYYIISLGKLLKNISLYDYWLNIWQVPYKKIKVWMQISVILRTCQPKHNTEKRW